MAAAYSNSIQALNGIYGALDQIIRLIDRPDSPEKTKEKNENTVKTLNKGGLSGDLTADKTSASSSAAVPVPASIRDMASALLALPPAIKAIAGLSDKSINRVVNLINRLNWSFSGLAENNTALKGAVTFKSLVQGLVALEEIKFFQLIMKLKMLETVDFEKTLGKTFTGLVKSYKALNDLSKKDIDNYIAFTSNLSNLSKTVKEFSKVSALMPIFNLAVIMYVPAMNKLIKMAKKMPDKSKMEAAIESTKLVSGLAKSVAIMVATAVGLGLAIQKGDTKSILTGIGITVGIMTVLTGLALTIEIFGRKSRGARRNLREINHFINGLAVTTGLIFGLAILYSMQGPAINKGLLAVGGVLLAVTALAIGIGVASRFLHIRREMNAITRFMLGMMIMTGGILVLGMYAAEAKPVMMEGLKIVMTVLTAVMGLALLTGIVMSFVHPVAMGGVMAFVGFSMLLVLGTFLIGQLVANDAARQTLLLGLGVTAGIMIAYTAIALGAAFLGMLVMEGTPFLKQVTLFAAFSLALVLGTIFVGMIATLGREYLVMGLGATLGIVLAYTGIAKAVSAMTKDLALAMPQLKILGTFAIGCIGVAFATVLLGRAMEGAGWWTVAALGLLGTIIASTYGIARLISRLHKFTSLAKAIPELKTLGLFLAAAEGLAAGVVGLAYAIKNLIGGEDWDRGAIAIAGTFGILTGIIVGARQVARYISSTKTEMDKAVIDIKSTLLFMGGAELLAGGIIGLAFAYKELGDTTQERLEYVTASFGLVAGIVTGGVVVAKQLAATKSTMEQGAIDIKSTLLFMGGAELLAGGILGIAYALKELAAEDPGGAAAAIAGAFVLVGSIVAGGVVLAGKISAAKPMTDKGKNDIKSILLFMGGAELLAGGVIALSKAIQQTSEKAILEAMGLVSVILFSAVKIAQYASTHSRAAKQGAKDIKDALLIMAGGEALVGGVIGLSFLIRKLDEGGNAEESVAKVFILMTSMILGAVGVAKLASNNQQNIKQGAVALLLAEGVIAGSAAVLFAVIKVAEQGKGKWEDVTSALVEMGIILAAAGTMAVVASKLENDLKKGAIGLALCEALAAGSALVLAAVIKVVAYGKEKVGDDWAGQALKALGEMALIVGAFGTMAYAAGALIVGPQALWFGAGVAGIAACEALGYAGAKMLKAMIEVSDLGGEEIGKKIGTTLEMITVVIKKLGETSAMGLRESIRIARGAAAFKRVTKISGALIENVDQLVKLSTYLEKSGTSTEDLKKNMTSLLDVLSPKMFVEFFDGMDKGEMKDAMKKVNKGYKSYNKVLKLVKSALEVYADFAVKTKGMNINEADLVGAATGISSSLSVFMEALNGKTYDISKKTVKRLSLVLSSLIEPISNFAELVSKYSGDGNTLKVITYDEQGKPHEGLAVNISDTARTILSAVMTFCDVLYNEENEKIWKNITQGVDSKGKSQSTLQSGIGIFASIMDPVVSFAEVLTMFGYDGEKGMLTIPEYDKEGKLINNRAVDVKNIASVIAGAVTTFIDELYVKHKDSWIDILSSLNMIDPSIATTPDKEEKTGNKAGLKEAIGFFGEILNPVLSFASVLLKFGTDKDSLTVIDENGKAKKVDVAAISANIAGGVTKFITSMADIFANQETIDKIKLLSENSTVVLDIVNGFVNDISNAAQIDAAKLALVNGSTALFSQTMQTLLDNITKNYTAQDLGMFKAVFKVITETTTDFFEKAFPEQSVIKMGMDVSTFIMNTKLLLNSFVTREELDNFKLLVTEFTDFLNKSVTDLMGATSSENIDISQVITNNDVLANQIKDSYFQFVNTISNFDNMDIISEKITNFKKFMNEGMAYLLSDFISPEALEEFGVRATSVRDSINASIKDMLAINVSKDDLAQYVSVTASIKEGMNNILGIQIDDVSTMKTTSMYSSIINSIHTLINEQEITNVDSFNKNYETLMKNLESSSQDSKVKKINNLNTAVVKTSNSLKGFDDTLNKGNSTRIKELNSFGRAVGSITDKLKSAQSQINDLRDLFARLEKADANNIGEIADKVSKMTSGSGGGGGGSINVTLLAEEIGKAVAVALNNTSLDFSNVRFHKTDDGGGKPKDVTMYMSGEIDVQSDYKDETFGS